MEWKKKRHEATSQKICFCSPLSFLSFTFTLSMAEWVCFTEFVQHISFHSFFLPFILPLSFLSLFFSSLYFSPISPSLFSKMENWYCNCTRCLLMIQYLKRASERMREKKEGKKKEKERREKEGEVTKEYISSPWLNQEKKSWTYEVRLKGEKRYGKG